MITVEFKDVTTAKCGWCGRDKGEVYVVAFSDQSFNGPLCKADLLRAVKMKCVNGGGAKDSADKVNGVLQSANL
jgi:hypothetical protein